MPLPCSSSNERSRSWHSDLKGDVHFVLVETKETTVNRWQLDDENVVQLAMLPEMSVDAPPELLPAANVE